MTSAERREQLITVSRSLFATRGYEGTSVEEIAAQAQVSKPVVYEHFGGKEGLYAVVVDREVRTLLDGIRSSLTSGRQRELIEQAAMALLDYIESNTDGFRILARDSSVGSTSAAPRSRRPANVRRVEVRGTAGLTHFRHSRRPVLKSTEVMAGTRVANGIMR